MDKYYTYMIVFHSTVDKEYVPIVNLKSIADMNCDTVHLLDSDMVSLLPALEFILQLPRLTMELYELDENTIDKAYDKVHDIYIVPDSVVEKMLVRLSSVMAPSLLICTDDCLNDVKNAVLNMPILFGTYMASELSQSLLSGILEKMVSYATEVKCKETEILSSNTAFLLHDRKQLILPAMFLARQYHCADKAYQTIFSSTDEEKDSAYFLANLCMRQTALKKLYEKSEKEKIDRNDSVKLETEYRKIYHELKNNPYVWRKLRIIGKLLDEVLNDRQRIILKYAKHISWISNFPVNMAIMPGAGNSLCCFKTVSFHPITPLSRTLTSEMLRHRNVFIQNKCKVIFAECILNDDKNGKVYAASEACAHMIQDECIQCK